jgi:SAM-dependent methyltransferase
MHDVRNEFRKIYLFCREHFSSGELWPSYYERRYQEFLTFYEFLPEKKHIRVLELGCGIGYYSAFLSKIADEVVATDLETIDPLTHSPGLQTTRNFLASLDIKNVAVMHASAEELPFEDGSFDLVFSSHVIEHVPDMQKAVLEINRVLKPGGYNFCIVPTTTDRIYAFFTFYIFVLQRAFAKAGKLLLPKKKSISAGAAATPAAAGPGMGFYFRHFPFPPPHGVYPHYLHELRKWTLGNWKKLLVKEDYNELHSQRGLQMNPLLPLLGNVLPKTGAKLFSWTRRAENKLSGNFLFRYFGISTLIITRKKA